MSINLFHSNIDKTRFRNGVVGLMLSEVNNRSIAYPPYGQYTTPAPLTPPGQPIVVVQPPAQYITVNSGIPVQGGVGSSSYNMIQPDRNLGRKSLNETFNCEKSPKSWTKLVWLRSLFIFNENKKIERFRFYQWANKSSNFFSADLCNPPRPDCIPKRRFHPNELPPQADKMYRILANMENEIKEMTNALGDAMAGNRPGYLDEKPYAKTPFPVWTPAGRKK